MQQQCSGPGGLTLDLERGRNSRRRTAPKQLGAEKAAAATLPPGLSQGQALLLDFTMILQYFLLGSAGNGFPDISFTGLDQGHKRLPGNLHFHPLSRLRAASGSYQELFMLWSAFDLRFLILRNLSRNLHSDSEWEENRGTCDTLPRHRVRSTSGFQIGKAP